MRLPFLLAPLFIVAPLLAVSPAEVAIRQSMANIEKQPAHYPYYNELAAAYVRRARETADAEWYGKAEESLKKSFALSPENFEGLKVSASIHLGRHEFPQALEIATRLNKTAPDDLAIYGYLVDANVALGNDEEAVAAAQWMLNLREGTGPGLIRAAHLRALHGNLTGALELLQQAYDAAPVSETEERAWLLSQTAHIELLSGDLAQAEGSTVAALAAFPNYDAALDELAQVRMAQARYSDAAVLQGKRYDAVPRAPVLYRLAQAQELAGRHDEAGASFREFEKQALAQAAVAGNANRELIDYYLDHASQPAKALAIAQREMGQRHDVSTLDAYAWALAGNGEYIEANSQVQKALAIGSKEPALLFHAGAIALHLHHGDQAQTYLKDAAARFSREAADMLGNRN